MYHFKKLGKRCFVKGWLIINVLGVTKMPKASPEEKNVI